MCFLKGKHEITCTRDKQFPGFLRTITLHPVAGVLFKVFIVTCRKCLVSKIVRFFLFCLFIVNSSSSFVLKLTE